MAPDTQRKLTNIILDVICLALVYGVWIILITVPTPYRRGFFCGDETIAYPYKDSTISTLVLSLVGVGLPIITILIIEGVHYYNSKKQNPAQPLFHVGQRAFPSYVFQCYRVIGCFLFGLGVVLVITNIGKFSIGRLRPHFLAVCQPDYSQFACEDAYGNNLYITADVCTNHNTEDHDKIKEMRLSFPSGHASISMYCMLFLAFYCHARLRWKGSKLLCPTLEAIFIAMAIYTSLSRITDNKHHWSDVLSGAIIGIFMAAFSAVHLSRLLPRSRRIRSQYSGYDITDDAGRDSNPEVSPNSKSTYLTDYSQPPTTGVAPSTPSSRNPNPPQSVSLTIPNRQALAGVYHTHSPTLPMSSPHTHSPNPYAYHATPHNNQLRPPRASEARTPTYYHPDFHASESPSKYSIHL